MPARSYLIRCSLLLGFLLLTGCSWFVAGGVGAIVYFLMQEGEGNAAPGGLILSPEEGYTTGGRVYLKYVLMDDENEACSIAVAFSPDGGATWSPAREIPAFPSEGTQGLSASPSGDVHLFVWNSWNDLGCANVPAEASEAPCVQLRITPTDSEGDAGASATSPPFRVNNENITTLFGGEMEHVDAVTAAGLYWKEPDTGGKGQLVVNQNNLIDGLDLDDGSLSRLAGTGTPGFTGDNAPADSTGLTYPHGVCAGGQGDYFIADSGANRIRRVHDTGFLDTVAGTGVPGYAGESTDLTQTRFSNPSGVAWDESRDLLWIADTDNHCIRAANLGNTTRTISRIPIEPGKTATILGTPGNPGYRSGTTGLSGSVGKYASLDVDGNGRPCVAYWDETHGMLKFARRDWDWQVWVLDRCGVGSHCSLAMHGLQAHVSYCDVEGGLKYLFMSDDDSWSDRIVDGDPDAGRYSSIGLDSAGNPFISHCALSTNELRIAWRAGSNWQTQVLDTGVNDTSLAVETPMGSARPHVAYYLCTTGDLAYQYFDGSSWSTLGGSKIVASSGTVGRYCSLALDASNRPHIAYYDPDANGGDVMYVYWDGSAWQGPISVDGGPENAGTHCSLSLDASGHPCISYHDASSKALRFASDRNSNDSFADAGERLDVDGKEAPDSEGTWSSIAMVGTVPGIAHVHAWCDPEHCRLRFSEADATWSTFESRTADTGLNALVTSPKNLFLEEVSGCLFFTENYVTTALNTGTDYIRFPSSGVSPGHVVIVAGFSGCASHLAWDGSNQALHAIYRDPNNYLLSHAVRTGNAWITSPIPDSSADSVAFPKAKADASGNLHLAFCDTSRMNIRYGVRNLSGTWMFEDPIPSPGSLKIPMHVSLAVGPGPLPAIAFTDTTTSNLMFLSKSGGTWQSAEVVDGSGLCCPQVSLAFDGAGRPAIVYGHDENDLKFARHDGASWNLETIRSDNGSWLGNPCLTFDSLDVPHVSFMCRNALMYAVKNGSWTVQTVDDYDTVGAESCIVVDAATDRPRIAYSDDSWGRCRFAAWDGSKWVTVSFGQGGGKFPSMVRDSSGTYFVSFTDIWGEEGTMMQSIASDLSLLQTTSIKPFLETNDYADGCKTGWATRFSRPSGIAVTKFGSGMGGTCPFDALVAAYDKENRIRVLNTMSVTSSTSDSFALAGVTIAPGEMRTILGDGQGGFDPADDGAVVDHDVNPVKIARPGDVAVDAAGNIFFSDTGNYRVRVLNAGRPAQSRSFAGKTVPAGAVDTLLGGQTGPGSVTTLIDPSDVTLDPITGEPIVTDLGGYVFRIDQGTSAPAAVAGNGETALAGDGSPASASSLVQPVQAAFDGEGNLYILDGDSRIRMVNLHLQTDVTVCGTTVSPGDIDTVIGGDVRTHSIDGPGGNAVDNLGDGGSGSDATFDSIKSIAVDARPFVNGDPNPRGIMYVADQNNFRIRAVNLNDSGQVTVAGVTIQAGEIDTVVGTGTMLWGIDGRGGNPADDFLSGVSPTAVNLGMTRACGVDGEGVLLVAVVPTGYILAVNTSSTASSFIGGATIAASTAQHIAGNWETYETSFNGDNIPATEANFADPAGLSVWRHPTSPAGVSEIYVSDKFLNRVRVVDHQGEVTTWVGTGAPGFNGDGVPPENVLVTRPCGVHCVCRGGGVRTVYFVDAWNARLRFQTR